VNALPPPRADDTPIDSTEPTRPGDVLALTGERPANDDNEDSCPIEISVDEGWEGDPSAPSFFVVGGPPSVLRKPRGSLLVTQAHGVIKRIHEDRLILGTPGSSANEITVGYRLPASVDLRALVGRRVRLTLEQERQSGGRCGQTFTIATRDDRVWLVARHGGVGEVSHGIGGVLAHVTSSANDGGPLVVALPDLQHIVAPAGETRMRIGASRYVAEFVSRDPSGYVAYIIADDALWH
jgi:hypothetical protein